MYIVHNINEIDNNNFFFGKNSTNNIIPQGSFIRLIYSNPLYTLNSILIDISFADVKIEKFYKKYKCSFDIENNRDIIQKLINLEDILLKKANLPKKKNYSLKQQIESGSIKIFTDNYTNIKQNIILKISGIWESDNDFGITYKFMFLSKSI